MDNQVIWTVLFVCVVGHVLGKISQIHISFGSTADVMKVTWSTSDAVGCHVEHWAMNEKRKRADASQAELVTDSWKAMKYVHMAEMTGLSPHQNYTYKITCNNEMSQEWSFQTQPSAQDRPIKVIFYGDMGYGPSSEKTLDVLEKDVTSEYYDAIFHIGDYAYDLESDGGWIGDAFMELIQPIAARVPYMTSPGNHELGHDFHHYRTRFSMPGADWPMPMDRLWYSYNIGLVHFIVYSTEVYFISNSDYMCIQFYWLLDDLTKANQNRDKQPWIVAMAHRPMYCSNNSTDDCTGWILGNKVKHGLEDLFYAQGVDLILQAHEHSYERLWPVYKDEVVAKDYNNPTVPIHIISGAAGSSEGANSMGEGKIWSAFRDKGIDSSFGRLQVFNASHLYFEQVIVKDGRTLDSIWLVQSRHGPNVANLNCSSEHAHHSCKCPVLFPVLAMLILGGVLFLISLPTSIYCFCMWKKNKRPICFRCCCRRQRLRHVRFHNMDEDGDWAIEATSDKSQEFDVLS